MTCTLQGWQCTRKIWLIKTGKIKSQFAIETRKMICYSFGRKKELLIQTKG